ncbi:MAG: cytosine deaminase [Nitrososphaera sp.]|nr:cytosine deaminase [Nitrososphaera sp.]
MLIIENASLFSGPDLTYVERGDIGIKDGVIASSASAEKRLDASGFLVIPAFINAHTHIADSIGKDIAVGSRLDSRVHPVFGAKKKILQNSSPEHIKAFIRNSATSMLQKGIAAFADFREGGPEGVALLKDAISSLPIKCVIFGRAEHYSDPEKPDGLSEKAKQDVENVLRIADGLGISGANENTDAALADYRRLASGKKLAIHAAESKETVEFSKARTGKTEVERIVQHLQPDILVHMTQATDDEFSLVAKKAGIVVCARANGILGAGLPRVPAMLRQNCKVAIGTDNVMLNSPDMFRELDYIWKASNAASQFIEPRDILKMATVNAARMLGLNGGCIEPGRAADLLFINKQHLDLAPIHDPYAAIIHRASQDSISAVMIDGKFVTAGRRFLGF